MILMEADSWNCVVTCGRSVIVGIVDYGLVKVIAVGYFSKTSIALRANFTFQNDLWVVRPCKWSLDGILLTLSQCCWQTRRIANRKKAISGGPSGQNTRKRSLSQYSKSVWWQKQETWRTDTVLSPPIKVLADDCGTTSQPCSQWQPKSKLKEIKHKSSCVSDIKEARYKSTAARSIYVSTKWL